MKSRILLYLLATALLLSMAGMTGCAIVDQSIALRYNSADPALGRQSGDIAITRAEPVQARKSTGDWVVGSLNNVYGVHQADLLSNQSIAEWITDALLLELKHAGYTAKTVAAFPQGTKYGIHLSDINAFLNVNKGNVSSETKHELKFNVDLYLNGVRIKSFTVASRDNQTLPLTVSQEKKEKIMLKSLQDAMQQLMPEIIAFTAKK